MNKIVAISGGKDSSAMALRLKEVEPYDYKFAITPTGRELPAMHDHWKRLEDMLESPLIRVPGPTLVERIVKYKALPNFRMRWCTPEVKIQPFISYALTVSPAVCLVGIRADETNGEDGRQGTDHSENALLIKQDFPFVRWGWGLSHVTRYLEQRAVIIPRRTDCDICFYQRLIEWFELWRDHLNLWMEGEALEQYTGHTFRSPKRDSWPAAMKDLRKLFESGKVPKETRNGNRKAMCSWCAR